LTMPKSLSLIGSALAQS